MWFALSMLLLFVGWCWYDSSRPPLLEGAGWSNDSDDEATAQLARLREMLDEPMMSRTECAVAWHEMGFMTSDDILPSTRPDWEEGTP